MDNRFYLLKCVTKLYVVKNITEYIEDSIFKIIKDATLLGRFLKVRLVVDRDRDFLVFIIAAYLSRTSIVKGTLDFSKNQPV